MGYSIYFGCDEGEPAPGPHLASGSGWVAWTDWVLGFDEYPESHCLAANGWVAPDEGLTDFATECEWLLEEEGDENLKAITRTLLQAAQHPPTGCTSIVVSDGTPPSDEGEDDGDEED